MIFNKNNTGAAELKELIGFIYKSINFNNLKSYIGFAERDIIRIIGKDVFNLALAHYNSDFYHYSGADPVEVHWAVLDQLVEKIQYPVAVHAYRRYVPSSDLTHSDKGRQIFVSEQEKPAFEWQIEKDDENLLRLAHEATDMLLEFLDEHIADMATIDSVKVSLLPWGTSAEYGATRELFIPTVSIFESVFLIGGSRQTFLSLVPFIKRVQENEIQASLTVARYDEIKAQFLADELTPENEVILGKVIPPLALLALSVAVKRLSSEILPAGIFANIVANVIKGKNPAGKQDRNEISSSFEKDGLRELARLQEYLRKIDLTAAGETFTTTDPDERIDATQKFVRL
jgi:hypothetical protein